MVLNTSLVMAFIIENNHDLAEYMLNFLVRSFHL